MFEFTSLSFSPCGEYLVIGSSNAGAHRTAESTLFLVRLHLERPFSALVSNCEVIWELDCRENLNVVGFHPHPGGGFVFGSDRGSLKMFSLYAVHRAKKWD